MEDYQASRISNNLEDVLSETKGIHAEFREHDDEFSQRFKEANDMSAARLELLNKISDQMRRQQEQLEIQNFMQAYDRADASTKSDYADAYKALSVKALDTGKNIVSEHKATISKDRGNEFNDIIDSDSSLSLEADVIQ